jgi:1-acyl-sn-glycerol-3-phosphate acyltransferase
MSTIPTPPAAEPQPPAAPPTSNLEPRTSNPIPTHLRYLTKFFIMPLMALATAFFGCISLICGLWDHSGRQQHAVAHAWARTMLALAFSRVAIVGEEKLVPGQAAVYASNHLSYMDTPVLFAMLPFQFRILAKQALWKIPFVGWYLRRSGQVPIDASSPRSAIAGLLRGVKALNHGLPIFVFPEGARSPQGTLRTMASGAAFMAIRAGVPLVPLTLIGTYELLPMHVYALRPRPLKLVVGDPIPTEGLTTKDADALTTRLFEAISRMYHEYSAQ